jgi:tetratricopeptide (TPR) repeat protein
MMERGIDPDTVLALFNRSAELARSHDDRAEVYRQMADFVSTMDEPERRAQAAEFARRAYSLNPIDPEIRRQLGSALHLLSYAAYASGRFDDALQQAREAVRFEWEGMEAALFDLSRAAGA